MEKEKLRQLAIRRLEEIKENGERKVQIENIYHNFFRSSTWKDVKTIGVTMATSLEFPTAPLIERAFATGRKVAIPKSLPKGEMIFHWIDSTTEYYTTKFGVEEPDIEDKAQPDELIFNRAGYRIGFGGGYYDRYLANYKGKTCSFVFAEQLMEDWQIEAFDQPIQQLFLS